jgi:AcrR family transcriptional regulator
MDNEVPMGRPPGTPTIEARDRLLQAAERLFAEKGFAATSVHEITDAAGVNRALLYYYFEDKHSLYAAVIDEGVAHFTRMLDTALGTPGTYPERLEAFVHGYLELIWSRPEGARVVHRCLLDGYQEEFRLLDKFQGGMQRLETFFREAGESGEFRVVDPAIAARSFIGPMFVFSLWRIFEADRFAREVLAKELSAQLLHGFVNTRAAPRI